MVMFVAFERPSMGKKQPPRAWFERFSSVVQAAGFSSSEHDPALFTHTSDRGRTLLLLYVDEAARCGGMPALRTGAASVGRPIYSGT